MDEVAEQHDRGQRAWSDDDVWEETPSELWAEAVVQVVDGERLLHLDEMPIDPRVVDLVAAWAGGDVIEAGDRP